MLVVAAFALLLYGGDLPKVARSWGKSFTEFRRSFSGIQKDINEAIYSEPQKLEYHPERTSYADDSDDEPVNASTVRRINPFHFISTPPVEAGSTGSRPSMARTRRPSWRPTTSPKPASSR